MSGPPGAHVLRVSAQKEISERQRDKQEIDLSGQVYVRCKRAGVEALPRGCSGLQFSHPREWGLAKPGSSFLGVVAPPWYPVRSVQIRRRVVLKLLPLV